jgi:hypothetical protein
MHDDLRHELRRLRVFAYGSTSLLCILALTAFARTLQKTKFEEIDVERINVVEKNGNLRLVISNRDRSPGPIAYGKPFGYPGGSRPGIIFFNDEGTENGGLTLSGKRNPDGTYRAVSHFSFDQYNQDQILYFQYIDNNGKRRTGLTIADRTSMPILDVLALRDSIAKMPEGPAKAGAQRRLAEPRPGEPAFAQRVYVGRDTSKTALVLLSDKMGTPRLRLAVDSLGKSSLDFLDANGRVTYSVADTRRR